MCVLALRNKNLTDIRSLSGKMTAEHTARKVTVSGEGILLKHKGDTQWSNTAVGRDHCLSVQQTGRDKVGKRIT